MGTLWAHLGTITDHQSQFQGIKKPLQPFDLSRYLAVFCGLWSFFKLVEAAGIEPASANSRLLGLHVCPIS